MFTSDLRRRQRKGRPKIVQMPMITDGDFVKKVEKLGILEKDVLIEHPSRERNIFYILDTGIQKIIRIMGADQ